MSSYFVVDTEFTEAVELTLKPGLSVFSPDSRGRVRLEHLLRAQEVDCCG